MLVRRLNRESLLKKSGEHFQPQQWGPDFSPAYGCSNFDTAQGGRGPSLQHPEHVGFVFFLNKNSQSITENVNTFPLLLYGLVPPAITCEISHIFRLTEVDSRWQGRSPGACQMCPWSQMRPRGKPQTSVSEKDLCPLQCVPTSFGYSTSKKTKMLNSSSKPHLTNGHLHLYHW